MSAKSDVRETDINILLNAVGDRRKSKTIEINFNTDSETPFDSLIDVIL